MKSARIGIRVDDALKKFVEEYAVEHHMTVSHLMVTQILLLRARWLKEKEDEAKTKAGGLVFPPPE